ncbi:uncharacterized protein [Nicotiana sylvestris]|uniref:uncharacterized protein n=1 Tax=Nicotiana sylvestris TaxID=4096 RepID=UPI00388CCE10
MVSISTGSETSLEIELQTAGSIVGVETTKSGEVGGKNRKGKERESKGARSAMRGKGKEVVDSLPTPMSLTKDTCAMRGSSKVKTPGTARANNKRKADPSITVETPLTRVRATRSQKKQSDVELEKALEESRRKAVAKGKKKMSEPVDVDEMDLVLRDKEETEEVEVLTPKPKKAKDFH